MTSSSARYLAGYCPQVLDLLARTLGVTLDSITPSIDLALATKDFTVAAVEVKEGTIAGAHLAFDGIVDGESFIHHDWYFFVQEGLEGYPQPKHEYMHMIDIEGKPSFEATIQMRAPAVIDHITEAEPGFYGTAGTAINAIPAVCAADPGIFYAPVFAPWNRRFAGAPVSV